MTARLPGGRARELAVRELAVRVAAVVAAVVAAGCATAARGPAGAPSLSASVVRIPGGPAITVEFEHDGARVTSEGRELGRLTRDRARRLRIGTEAALADPDAFGRQAPPRNCGTNPYAGHTTFELRSGDRTVRASRCVARDSDPELLAALDEVAFGFEPADAPVVAFDPTTATRGPPQRLRDDKPLAKLARVHDKGGLCPGGMCTRGVTVLADGRVLVDGKGVVGELGGDNVYRLQHFAAHAPFAGHARSLVCQAAIDGYDRSYEITASGQTYTIDCHHGDPDADSSLVRALDQIVDFFTRDR